MSFHWHTYPSARETAAAAARHITTLLGQALAANTSATLALSGGSTPRLLFDELVRQAVDWERVHLFWVDERAVPPTHEDSNYRLAAEHLLGPAQVPARNVHRVHAEMPPEAAAARYRQEIASHFRLSAGELPIFDIIQLGMGGDAHTASLFPGEPLVEDRASVAAAVYVEAKTQWRITLLPGSLLPAHHTVALVTGADKAEAVRAVFEEPYQPRRYPAQITHHARSVVWFLDAGAARLLTR